MALSSKLVTGLSPEEKRALAQRLLRNKARLAKSFPLSFAQERLWFLHQLEPNSPFYNIPLAVRLKGRLDVPSLQKTLSEIVARHETLRTRFPTVEGAPVQRILAPRPVRLTSFDLRLLPPDRREVESIQLVDQEAQQPFDLESGPLVRFGLIRLADDDHVAMFTMHHIISDGWSMGVLINEMASLYNSFSKAMPSALGGLSIQYADYAVWQRQHLAGSALDRQIEYWKKRLAGMPAVLDLPTDRPRPAIQTFNGKAAGIEFSESVSVAIKELSRTEGTTLFMTLIAVFGALLCRYSGQERIVAGTPIAGRNRAELEPLIGFFVNTLVIGIDLSGDPTFRQLLARVRETVVGAFANQDVPFERLVEELQPERSLSYLPIFQVMFSLQQGRQEELRLPGLELSSIAGEMGSAKFDLTAGFADIGGRLSSSFEYNTDLFDETTVVRMLCHLERLIEGMAESPDQPVSLLPMLLDDEQNQILVDWNPAGSQVNRASSVTSLFESAVLRVSDSIAVVELVAGSAQGDPPPLGVATDDDLQLSYEELNRRANKLAWCLLSKNVGHESVVGVLVERSADLVIAMLGALKAGAAYLPLDPSHPMARLSQMINDAVPAVLVTTERFRGLRPGDGVVCLDSEWETIGAWPEQAPQCATIAENLTYVMYTSGSTGQPKGIEIPHRGVIRLTVDTNWIRLTQKDVMGQVCNASFDVATFEIWGALLNGARLVIIPRATTLSTEAFRAAILKEGITKMFLPTALFHQLVERESTVFSTLDALMVGGDVLDPTAAARQLTGAPSAKLIDGYGPTENTTLTTVEEVRADDCEALSVPIGKPVNATQVYLLDKNLSLVPIRIAGELCTGGDGLARGYCHSPDLTAERFIPDALSTEPGARIYRTGDLARWRADGKIEFLGRIDKQVKVRGFRVEPGEVESALSRLDGVSEAAVVAREDQAGLKRLVGYVVLSKPGATSGIELQDRLSSQFPEYMVPSEIVTLDAMPLSPNGKVDRKALPEPDGFRNVARIRIAPRNDAELRLVGIWESLLGVEPIGVTDDFFKLGGHSLLAVRLMSRIEQAFGKTLPLAALFQGATIERLAARLREGARAERSPLARIRTTGSKRPFFCVHPGGGNALCYVALARHLGDDQPIYAFQAAGIEPDEEPVSSVEEMAARYVAAMRLAQPEGPYTIGGWSMGGVVAFEMARLLEEMGETVNGVVLIDSRAPDPEQSLQEIDDLSLIVSFAWDLGLSIDELDLALDDTALPETDQLLGHVLEEARKVMLVPVDIVLADVRRLFRVFKTNFYAMMRYRPKPINASLVLIKARERLNEAETDSMMGWSDLSRAAIELKETPGDHFTIMREPNVSGLGSTLGAVLTALD